MLINTAFSRYDAASILRDSSTFFVLRETQSVLETAHGIDAMKHPSPTECKPSVWQKVRPNLVRYAPSGTYFLYGRFHGSHPVRESLKTKSFRVACVKLEERIREKRNAARCNDGVFTLLDAVHQVKSQIENDPALKASTRLSHLEILAAMEPGKAAAVPAVRLASLKRTDLQVWWRQVAGAYAPQRANHHLMFMRRAVELGRKIGLVRGDPIEGLKRLKIPRTRLKTLTGEQFKSLVADVRAQRKANSEQAAQWIEFAVYSGLRASEQEALEWSDVNEQSGFLLVRGGVEGTKNREVRRVPMIPALIGLLPRLRARCNGSGKIFSIGKPRDALRGACERLGIPRLRIHDLRHLHASMAIASGVDVAVLAEWLGHRDGGTLCLRTYVHVGAEHSKRMAAKVRFE